MKSRTVLLVDDHQIILDGIRLMLEKEPGLRIVAASSDPQKAIQLARELDPDIIIADISMPGMNGIDFTHHIRKTPLKAKVIILSMYATEDYICRMIQAGANGYLTKQGTTKVELLNAINAVMEEREYFSPEVQEVIMNNYLGRAKKGNLTEIKPATLTKREQEILKLYAEGCSNQEIAKLLFISLKTVDAHKNNIMQKFNFRSTVDMVKYAIRNKLVEI